MIGDKPVLQDNLKIGNNVKIAAKSGIMIDIPDGDFQMGGPSFNAREYKKSYIHFMNLDKLAKRINQLEKALKDMRK